jgi:AcrR family transcriptional regulator
MSSGERETRERILRQTCRLMDERGGQGVRLEDVAAAAGVSRQAVYLHFGSRAGLLIAAVRSFDETLDLAGRTRPMREAPDGATALRELVRFWAGHVPQIYGPAKAMMAGRLTDEAVAAAWDDRMDAVRALCLDVTERIAREESLAPGWTADSAADFLAALLSIETWERLQLERGWSPEQYTERLQDAAHRALIHEPSPSGGR